MLQARGEGWRRRAANGHFKEDVGTVTSRATEMQGTDAAHFQRAVMAAKVHRRKFYACSDSPGLPSKCLPFYMHLYHSEIERSDPETVKRCGAREGESDRADDEFAAISGRLRRLAVYNTCQAAQATTLRQPKSSR